MLSKWEEIFSISEMERGERDEELNGVESIHPRWQIVIVIRGMIIHLEQLRRTR